MNEYEYLLIEVKQTPKVKVVRKKTRKNRIGFVEKKIRYLHHELTVLTFCQPKFEWYDEIRKRYSIPARDSMSIEYKMAQDYPETSETGWIGRVSKWLSIKKKD